MLFRRGGPFGKRTGRNLTKRYPSEHRSWLHMRSRCLDPRDKNYLDYGGRGITICERWLDFTNFFDDMHEKPTPAHTLERRDNMRGYSPDNCYWADRQTQSENRRANHLLTFNGRTLCLSQWAQELNLDQGTIWMRWKRHWPIEKVLSPHRCSKYCTIHHPNMGLKIDGELHTIRDWSHRSGIPEGTIAVRLYRGWLPQTAVFSPLRASRWH